MRCPFCDLHKFPLVHPSHGGGCAECQEYIFKDSQNFGKIWGPGPDGRKLSALYYRLPSTYNEWEVTVFFRYDHDDVLFSGSNKGAGFSRPLLTVPMMPFTKEVLESLPEKFRTWLVFS